MNAIIVTCAGCGKRYKGASGSKKFKCGECSNLFSYPDAPRSPSEGHTFCTLCWTELAQIESLKDCPNCRQKIKFTVSGKAVLTGSGAMQQVTPSQGVPPTPQMNPTFAAPPASASSAQHAAAGDNTAELQAQLAAVRKERDELLELAKHHEKTKTVLFQRVAFSEASKNQAAPQDETAKWELQMEVGELKTKLTAMQEDLQKKVLAAQDELSKAEKIRDDALTFAEMKMAEMEALAVSPAKSAEVEAQIAKLTRERDDAVEGMSQAKFNLDRYREAAVTALEPLGHEYTRAMKDLTAETDSMLTQLHQQQADANKRMEEQLNAAGAAMKERIKAVRREMAERLSAVLGTPAEQSLAQMPAVGEESGKATAETAA